jgi:hypothetical protein
MGLETKFARHVSLKNEVGGILDNGLMRWLADVRCLSCKIFYFKKCLLHNMFQILDLAPLEQQSPFICKALVNVSLPYRLPTPSAATVVPISPHWKNIWEVFPSHVDKDP